MGGVEGHAVETECTFRDGTDTESIGVPTVVGASGGIRAGIKSGPIPTYLRRTT